MEFIKIYEELNSLNEAVSPEEKAFLDSLKKGSVVDTESFIKAFKSEIPDDIGNKLFDRYMLLKGKGTYGTIKESTLPENIKTALKKYGVLIYKDYNGSTGSIKTTTEQRLKQEEEERKKKEEERRRAEQQVKIQPYIDRVENLLKSIDKIKYSEGVKLWKEEYPDRANKILDFPIVKFDFGGSRFSIYISTGVWTLSINTKGSDQDIINNINRNVEQSLQEVNKVKQTRLSKERSLATFKNAKWGSDELVDGIEQKRGGIFIFQYPDDDGIQRLENPTGEAIDKCNFADDVELVAVRHYYSPPMHNPNSATETSYGYTYYSINSNADPMALDTIGVFLNPADYKDTISGGKASYKEVSSTEAEKNSSYFKANMNKGFLEKEEYGGSE